VTELARTQKALAEEASGHAHTKETLAALSAEFQQFRDGSEATLKDSSAALGGTVAELATVKKALAAEQSAHTKVKSILEALAQEYKDYKDKAEASMADSAGGLASTSTELATVKKALAEEQAAHAQLKAMLAALAQEYKDYKDKAEASMAESSALAEDRRRYVLNPPCSFAPALAHARTVD